MTRHKKDLRDVGIFMLTIALFALLAVVLATAGCQSEPAFEGTTNMDSLTLSGNLSAVDGTFSDDVTITDDLTVSDDATVTDDLNVGGDSALGTQGGRGSHRIPEDGALGAADRRGEDRVSPGRGARDGRKGACGRDPDAGRRILERLLERSPDLVLCG